MIKKTAIAAAACALAASSGIAAASHTRIPQYDQFFASQATADARAGLHDPAASRLSRHLHATPKNAHLGPRGIASHFDRQLGANTFLWLNNGKSIAAKTASAPMKRAAQAESVARAAIAGNASALAAGRIGMKDARLAELQDNGKGVVIARFQQRVGEREVFNRRMAVLMDQQLTPKAIAGYFAPDAQVVAAKRAPATFSLSGADAIAAAFAQMGGRVSPGALQVRRTAGQYAIYNRPASTGDYRLGAAPRVKEVLYPSGDKLIPAYYVELAAGPFDVGVTDRYSFVVAADSGKILFRNNQVAHEANTYEVYADAGGIHQPYDGPLGNDLEPVTLGPDGPFARVPATRNSITLDHGPIDSDDPWLPSGASVTTGNNVDAYVDLDDYLVDPDTDEHGDTDGFTEGGPDFRGAASSPGAFVYPYTPDADPATDAQRQAAITNLFYMNNWLHDWWYHNGFDEAAGNAQTDNYGRGGVDGDPIHAEGQDASSTNNADMSTPSDGGSPRMQMYIFNVVDSSLTVNSPASVAGDLDHGTAEFGPTTFDLTSDIVVSAPEDACGVPGNGAALAGKIALVARGTCTFAEKVKNAQLAGAAGVIISNNVAGDGPIGFSGDDDTITIPSFGISLEDGDAIRAALGDGPVNATMHELTKTARDGTMDNGIIAHEWFHYVSNRLVGDANGLYNNQGRSMGEGWSDFSTLMLIVRPEDRMVPGNDHWQGVYSTGTYVDESQYFGIRRVPYSTDLAVNPLTFKHIENGVALPTSAPIAFGQGGTDNAEVHASGEIWANVLWEIYASLLNDERYTFEQAQDRMKDYVIAALKLTPSAPTFLEARDALLAVAATTDAGDFDLMAKAFAKRGMGVGAVAPDRADDTHAGVVESFEPFGKSFVVDDASVDFAYDDGTAGYCDLDGVLDAGETARLTLTIRSTGTASIAGPITAHLLPVDGVSYPGGDTITFTSLGLLGDTMTGTVLVKLDAANTAAPIPLQIEFPQVGVSDGDVSEPETEEVDLAVNYDLVPDATSDGMEQPLTSMHDWDVTAPDAGLASWSVRDGAGLDVDDLSFDNGKLWYAPDNDGTSDIRLTTPPLEVGDGDFTFSFTHYYKMELA
ncbi:MAG TPA: M36 family metallopeptidase, partial [Solimonas sp.]|nr:M36 family metallopeptidase [Solimonas sp.]